jgi:hypothetical protein
MKDEGLATAAELPDAEAAVNYLLQRVQVDADLRWHMLGTEAFHRLCVAEAKRTGMPVGAIEANYSIPLARCADDKPKLVACRLALQQIKQALVRAAAESPTEERFGENVTATVMPLLERLGEGG